MNTIGDLNKKIQRIIWEIMCPPLQYSFPLPFMQASWILTVCISYFRRNSNPKEITVTNFYSVSGPRNKFFSL